MLHKDYDRNGCKKNPIMILKGLGAKKSGLTANRQS
jgi:hypothetical protein